ncbi:MAG: dockerin type I domain-containing protein, partial [Planctomycetota bacterium]
MNDFGQPRKRRKFSIEPLESRQLLASDFTNPVITRDVNGDDAVSPLDALIVINELHRRGGPSVLPDAPPTVEAFIDVSGDGHVSALDALLVINSFRDQSPPSLDVSLANDTGIDGVNSDTITSDPSIKGIANDELGIAFFTIQIGDADTVRVFPESDANEGQFLFDPELATDGTDDGTHLAIVTATDQRGLTSEPVRLIFELDTQVDFAAVEDFFVQYPSLGLVTLVGFTEPLSQVSLGELTVNSQEDLRFQISGVSAVEGDNALTLEVIDQAGNQRVFEQTFNLSERPEVEIDLQTDSARGNSGNNDRLTRIPNVVGRIEDLSTITELRAGINTEDVSLFVDLTDLLTDLPDGGGSTFVIDSAAFARVAGGDLPDGEHRLRVIAEDASGNVSQVASTFFELDSSAPGIEITSPIEGEVIDVGDRLAGQVDLSDPTATLSYRFGDGGLTRAINMASDGSFSTVIDFRGVENGLNEVIVTSEDDAGNVDEVSIGIDVQVVVPFQLTNTFPASGQSSVGVTFKPSVQFASPVDPATVTPESVYLSTGGVKLDVNAVVSDDGLQATIFPQANLPSSSTISLTVEGDRIQSPDGTVLDGNFNDQPGGLFRANFTTLNMAPIPNTAVVGRVISPGPDNLPFTADDSEPGEDGIRGTDDDVFLLPLAGVEVNLQGGSQVVTTD